mgnify:CR=1 FL=1
MDLHSEMILNQYKQNIDLFNKIQEIVTNELKKIVSDLGMLVNSVESRVKTDSHSLSKLLARFDRKQVSNLSLENVLREKLSASEEQILYIRERHRMHNIKYN